MFFINCFSRAEIFVFVIKYLSTIICACKYKVEYLIIKPLGERWFHNIEKWTDMNWQNASKTLNMGHRGCGSTFGSGRYENVNLIIIFNDLL